jgi:signal transduction histidine kinase
MAAASLVEAAFGRQNAGLDAATVLMSLALGAACVLAWFAPLAAVVVDVCALALPPLFVELPLMGGAHLITTMLVVGNAAYRSSRRVGAAAYALGAFVPAATIVLAGETVWEFLFFLLIMGPAWAVGVLLRRERERSAELLRLTEALRVEREKQAEVAVAAERTRVSRELHDAVAHTVSVMTLQVGVVRRRLARGSVEEETLHGAETLGRQAVDELRRIVGLVREGEAPALVPLPSLGQLEELVDQVRATGTEVRLAVDGDVRSVGQAVDMSAYRIVQEALTNALRHAPGAAVDVAVTVRPSLVELRVANGPARRAAPGSRQGGGNGLPGIRERVHVLGGSLQAAPGADGGFVLAAVLPDGSAAPRPVPAAEVAEGT